MIKNFYELKTEYDKKRNEELTKTGIFYAFSNEQWERYKTHKDAPDSEYIAIGAGAYIHKSNKSKLDNFFNNTSKQLKKDFVSKVGIESIIEYELSNYECYYTGNYSEIIPIIESYLDSPSTQRNNIINQIEKIYAKNIGDASEW